MKYLDCVKCGKKAAWVTVWANVAGMILKGVVGYYGGSKALIADSFHSGADAVIGLVTVGALKVSGEGPDKEHPYGHGKVEFIAAAVVTAALAVAVVFLFIEAIGALHAGLVVKPHVTTLVAVAIAIVTSEMLFRFNLCAGKNLSSPVLIANAWHNRYDVYTSLVVAVGILGSIFGLHYLDPLAAIGVGLVIIKVSYEILSEAYSGLMDTALPKKDRDNILRLAKQAGGDITVTYLKTRRAGQKIWIDMGVRLDPLLSVSEGYKIREEIREMLFLKMENVGEVQVEILAANKGAACSC